MESNPPPGGLLVVTAQNGIPFSDARAFDITLYPLSNAQRVLIGASTGRDVPSAVSVGAKRVRVSVPVITDHNVIMQQSVTVRGNLDASSSARLQSNLDVGGDAVLHGNLDLTSNLRVGQSLIAESNLEVASSARMLSNLYVGSDAVLHGKVDVTSNLTVGQSLITESNLAVASSARLLSNLEVISDSVLCGKLAVTSNLTVGQSLIAESNLVVASSARLLSNLEVNSDAVLRGKLVVTSNLAVGQSLISKSNLEVASTARLLSNLEVNSDAVLHGNMSLTSNLSVGHSLIAESNLEVASSARLLSNLEVFSDTALHGNVHLASNLFVGETLIAESNMEVASSVCLWSNLEVRSDAVLQGDLDLTSNLTVGQSLVAKSNLDVASSARLLSNLEVGSDAVLHGNLGLTSNLTVGQSLAAQSNLEVSSDAVLHGNLDLASNLTVGQSLAAESNLFVKNDTVLHGNLAVGQSLVAESNLEVTSSARLLSNLEVISDVVMHGNVDAHNIRANALTVSKATSLLDDLSVARATALNDTVVIAGATTLRDTLSVAKAVTMQDDLTVVGNLLVHGDTVTLNTQTIELEDNIITLNRNQTGTPSSLLVSGIEVNRGDLPNYKFAFEESSGVFKVGETGSLQAVATRQDAPEINSIPIWDAETNQYVSRNDFVVNNGMVGIGNSAPISMLDIIGHNSNMIATFRAHKTTDVNDGGIGIGSMDGNTPYITTFGRNNGLLIQTDAITRLSVLRDSGLVSITNQVYIGGEGATPAAPPLKVNGSAAFGSTASANVVIGDKEVKFLGSGYTNFSLVNSNDVFALLNTSDGDTLGTSGTPVVSIHTSGDVTTNGSVTSTRFTGPLAGNASTATTLAMPRAINGTNFDGSAAITTAQWGTPRNLTVGNTAKSVNGGEDVAWTIAEIGALPLTGGTVTGPVTATGFTGPLTGNATTATTLATPRTINGTNFNGSAAITTAQWGTPRNLTVGNTAKSVNGTSNVAWTIAEIGALPLTGGVVTGTVGASNFQINGYDVASALNMPCALRGGGVITWSGNKLLWSARMFLMPVFDNISTDGYAELACPTSGTITYYTSGAGISAKTCTTEGVPLAEWDSLYYRVVPGSDSTSVQGRFVAVSYGTNWVPDCFCVLVAARNADNHDSLKWMAGQVTLPNNSTYNSVTGACSWLQNVDTAVALATARAINGTSFDGSAAITTANWGTARNLTVGSTAKPVNGSANVSWTLAEIGALPIAGGGTIHHNSGDGLGNTLVLKAPAGLNHDTAAPHNKNGSLKFDYSNSAGWNAITLVNNDVLSGSISQLGDVSMRNVYASSKMGVGTTNPSYELHVVGGIHATGNISAFSDARVKTDLQTISDPLSKVRALTGYTYERTDTDAALTSSSPPAMKRRHVGVIAQDVNNVLPEAVTADNEGMLGVNYNGLVALLVEAVKTLDGRMTVAGM